MPEIPECLNRRYKALDELIQDLSASSRFSHDFPYKDCSSTDPGVKLMCDFWDILKEDPDCNLTQAVKHRMGLSTESGVFKPQKITCYMANKKSPGSLQSGPNKCNGSFVARSPAAGSDVMPLNKALCNLKEAASFDKRCNNRINDLIRTQKELQYQIAHLEEREKEGVKLLKQADCMWSCMEEAYKKRIAESMDRQKELMKELKEVEASKTKWRKNKKDLDSQVGNINKCHQDILEKLTQKNNDIKYMDMEINDFKKRIESNKKETEAVKKSVTNRRKNSDLKIANLAADMAKLNKSLNEEVKNKQNKEKEGNQYVKEAREDLQKICRVLMQKKMENEDLKAEKDTLQEEIDLLKQTYDQCKDKCKNNQQAMIDEIKKLDQEIKDFKVKCIKCHQCTDTQDARKFCSDCPKCIGERECINNGDHCTKDDKMDCVCMSVKNKFVDNVFENMYTVLEKQSKTKSGKVVADEVLNCLKNSRNGKLNAETRKILQDFILNTVKKNLNLTIIGGAVKTRCELDPETYEQLMTCLKQVTIAKPVKEDKATAARKEPCGRWGGPNECNCPNGPKSCVCSRQAQPPADLSTCPSGHNKEDKKTGETQACPHKASTACGPDCGKNVPNPDLSSYRSDPCSGPTCSFSTNVRTQFMVDPESFNSITNKRSTALPYVPDNLGIIYCKCEKCSNEQCTCKRDEKQIPAGIAKLCDNACCTSSSTNQKENVQEEEIRKESYLKYPEKKATNQNVQPNAILKNDIIAAAKPLNIICRNKNEYDSSCNDKVKKDKQNIVAKTTILHYTPSGKLYVEFDEQTMNLINKTIDDDPSIVFTLEKTNSDNYIIHNDSQNNVNNSDLINIIVRINPSGSRVLEVNQNLSDMPKLNQEDDKKLKGNVIKELKDQLYEDNEITNGEPIKVTNKVGIEKQMNPKEVIREKFYKLKIKIAEADNFTEPLAVLKLSQSNNYTVIPDKEYENEFNDVKKDLLKKDTEYYAQISQNDSNCSVVISFEEHKEANAVLVRTKSERIRIIRNSSSESIISPKKKVSLDINDFFDKMAKMNNHFKNNVTVLKKSMSDSNIYEKSISLSSNNKDLLEESHAVLKKTDSGKYAVVLENQCKNSFIKNLKNYLQINPYGKVPVRKTSNGDIIIVLNEIDKDKIHYGSLKITPSRNIYVTVDEDVVKQMAIDTNSDVNDTFSNHFIGKIQRPRDKEVTTTCNAKPEKCACDESKCVCSEIRFEKFDWTIGPSVPKDLNLKLPLFSPHVCGVDWSKVKRNKDGSYKVCDPEFCTEECCSKSSKNNKLKSANIFIKECTCNPVIEKKSRTKQCYYVIEATCPYHINKDHSDDLIVFSKSQEKFENFGESDSSDYYSSIEPDMSENGCVNVWNSLAYLPPQLPQFLRNMEVKYQLAK